MPDSLLEVRPLRMPEAEKFWASKVPMPAKEFYKLAENQRVNAFTVSGVADMDQLHEVWRGLGKALAEGQSFETWRKGLPEALAGFKRRRLETIFRNGMQTANAVGRYAQMKANTDDRPWWMYDAINDRRTRPTHRALDGKVFRFDHKFWETWYPPNGHRCRCSVRALSDRDLARRGLTPETEDPTGSLIEIRELDGSELPEIPLWPDAGFASSPALDHYKPDLAKYPAHFRQAFLERLLDRVCPDDWASFADSPCFLRLKRALKQDDLEALQALVWARSVGGVEGFPAWANAVMRRGKPSGELFPVGNLPPSVLRELEAVGVAPILALTLIDDVELLHATRLAKELRGQTLSIPELAAIPLRFHDAEWLVNTQDKTLLLAWQRLGSALWLKIVIKVDRKFGKGKANQIITCGVVKRHNLEEEHYTLVRRSKP